MLHSNQSHRQTDTKNPQLQRQPHHPTPTNTTPIHHHQHHPSTSTAECTIYRRNQRRFVEWNSERTSRTATCPSKVCIEPTTIGNWRPLIRPAASAPAFETTHHRRTPNDRVTENDGPRRVINTCNQTTRPCSQRVPRGHLRGPMWHHCSCRISWTSCSRTTTPRYILYIRHVLRAIVAYDVT